MPVVRDRMCRTYQLTATPETAHGGGHSSPITTSPRRACSRAASPAPLGVERHQRIDRHVFVVAHGRHLMAAGPPVLSDEHRGHGLFDAAELPGLALPNGYRRVIEAWVAAPHP
jgi:hypothetical protein